MQITLYTSPTKIFKEIEILREKKGREKEALKLIDQALEIGHDWIIKLFWEKVLTYQHLVMNEDAKPDEERDRVAREKALAQMIFWTQKAGYYIDKFHLDYWQSRKHRFLGRAYDYQGKFKKSVIEYKKAIPLAKKDPDYIEKKYPRWLELQAFLSYSLIMSGNINEGFKLAEKTYRDFDLTKEGKFLKTKDYTTWVIWKTGIPVRTINAFIQKKITFDRKRMVKWLEFAGVDLYPDKKVKVWSDFSFRRAEIEAVNNKLGGLS